MREFNQSNQSINEPRPEPQAFESTLKAFHGGLQGGAASSPAFFANTSRNSIKYHEKLLPLQSMFLSKRFDIYPPDLVNAQKV